MARIKYGSLVSSISGSIGSATFQKSSFGDTLRTKPRPRISHTSAQYNCRSIMVQIHNAWHLLSIAQRTQWDKYISFASATIRRDKNIFQSGHSYFIKYNFLRLLCGLSIQQVPLYGSFVIDTPAFILEWVDFENEWNFDPLVIDIGSAIWGVLKLSYKTVQYNSFNSSGLRYMPIPVNDEGIYSMRDIYYNIFGYYLQDQDWVNYELQYFGLTSSIISGKYTGTQKLY